MNKELKFISKENSFLLGLLISENSAECQCNEL